MAEENTNYTPPVQSVEKPKKTVSTFIGIAIIVIIAIVIFGGVFAWQYFAIKNYPGAEILSGQNAEWKTYTNTQYGFQISYVTDASNIGVNISEEGLPTVFVLDKDYYSIDENDCLTKGDPLPSIFVKKLTINEMIFCMTLAREGDLSGREMLYYNYTTKKDGKYFVAKFDVATLNPSCDQSNRVNCFDKTKAETFFESLLSTFKFTDSATTCIPEGVQYGAGFRNNEPCCSGLIKLAGSQSGTWGTCINPTAGWKTYINTQYGFEIKYPADWSYGDNLYLLAPNMVFCSPKFSDAKTGCEWHNTNMPSPKPTSNSEVALFIGKKPGGTFSINNIGMQNCQVKDENINGISMSMHNCGDRGVEAVWFGQSNSNIYNLRLFDNMETEIFNKIISTFKFTTPQIDRAIRSSDLNKFVKESRIAVSALGQEMNTPEYADLNGDGKEEAIFTVFSGGTSGSFGPFVVGLENGKLVQLKIEKDPVISESVGSNWGHIGFSITDNKLVKSFPLYKSGDANCCPSGGVMYITYGWDNQTLQFIVDKTNIKK